MTVLEGPNGSLHFSTKIQLLEGEGDRREEMGKEKPRMSVRNQAQTVFSSGDGKHPITSGVTSVSNKSTLSQLD